MKLARTYLTPGLVVLLSAAAVAWAQYQPELDSNIRLWIQWLVPILGCSLILLWVILFSPVSSNTKSNIFIGVALGLGVVACLFRVEGSVSGSGLPRFVWRWASVTKELPPQSVSAQPKGISTKEVLQFLGDNRSGILSASNITTDWASHPPKQLWRHSIGEGWSSFCVVGGRAVTQEQQGEAEWVSCYDLLSGDMLWHHEDPAHFQEWQSGPGPRATPTFHDGKIYTLGATGVLNCLDAATGTSVWTRNVLTDSKSENLTWGLASSPLIHGDKVIVAGGSGPALLAYDRTTGKPLWQADTGSASYASPMVATLAGTEMILCNHAKNLCGHDPATGKVLFSHDWGSDKMPKCSQPIVLPGDRVFVSAGYQMGCEMLKLSKSADASWTVEVIWANKKMKTQFNSVTPMGDAIYGLDDGSMACVDIASGERLWKEGRFGAGQHLLIGDNALIQSERGPVVLAQVSPTGLKELSRSDMLSSKTWNYPTLAGHHLLVRNDHEVACYDLSLK
jgi:outer membrane protein assembly factor BamB